MSFNNLIRKFYDDGSDDAAAISGSASVASAAIGAMAQSNLNKKTQQFDVDMYNRQRADALSDWNRNNAYNAPSAQMARFQAAGLNPNLIYGKGDAGDAAPVRSSSVPAWNPKAPDYSGVAQGIGNAFNVKLQQIQLKNQEAQNSVIMADAALKASQKANVDADTQKTLGGLPGIPIDIDSKQFDLNLKKALFPNTVSLSDISVDQAMADLQKTGADTQFTLDKNDRETIMQSQNLKEGLQRILESKQRVAQSQVEIQRIQQMITNLKTSNTLDELDSKMKNVDVQNKTQFGIEKHDAWYFRVAARVLHTLGFDPTSQDTTIPKQPLVAPDQGNHNY